MRKLVLLIIVLSIANLGQAPAVKGGTVTGTVVAVSKGKPIKTTELWVYLESTVASKTPAPVRRSNFAISSASR